MVYPCLEVSSELPLPSSLSTYAATLKFQQEMLAGQIRHYQNRYQQCRNYIEKMKHELAQLRK